MTRRSASTARPWRARLPWLVAALALATLPLGGRRWIGGLRAGSDTPVRSAPRAIPAGAARPVWTPVAPADSLTSAIDFTLAGDTLMVLDALGRRVVLLRLEGGAWRPLLSMGRRGGGPGEFLRPRSLALVGDSAFAVLEEDGRLQFFGRDGRHRLTETPSLPCPMFAPALAFTADGERYAAGNCAGPGAARDTIFSVLFARAPAADAAFVPTPAEPERVSPTPASIAASDASDAASPGGAWREVARIPRIALDLSWGSTFATLHPLAHHGGAVYFGTGVTGCMTRVQLGRQGPGADGKASMIEDCGLVAERFRLTTPPELTAKQREARRRGDRKLERALAWPDVLPAYFGVVPAGDDLLLARPIDADRLAFVPAHAPFDANAVRLLAPIGTFVTCTSGACLWYDPARSAIALVSFSADGRALQPDGR